MAKNKQLDVKVAESEWDGALVAVLGTYLLMILVVALMAAIGAAIAVALGVVTIGDKIALATQFGVMEIAGVVLAALFVLIGLCWAIVICVKFNVRHTIICGQRLKFTVGTLNLFFTFFKWVLLTIISVGIYGLWITVKYRKWIIKHTVSYPEYIEEIQEEEVVEEKEEEVVDPTQPQITYYTVEE